MKGASAQFCGEFIKSRGGFVADPRSVPSRACMWDPLGPSCHFPVASVGGLASQSLYLGTGWLEASEKGLISTQKKI